MDRRVDLFLGNVKQAVHVQLTDTVKEINQELIKVAQQKGKNVSEDEMDEACKKLHNRLKVVFGENVDKFSLYSNRNVFADTLVSPPTTVAASSSSNMELQDLRERYLSVHGEYTRLFIECRDYDLLLKDLRETLFGLRVASQVFDEYDVNPIAHSCANLSQQKADLLDLYATANKLLDKIGVIRGAIKSPSKKTLASTIEGGSASVMVVDGTGRTATEVQTADIDDIQLLARSVGK